MGAKVNLVGQKFNRLTVIKQSSERRGKSITWDCQCECGNHKQVLGKNLKNGTTKSCGCFNKEVTSERNKQRSTNTYDQVLYRSEYDTWVTMWQRCRNPNSSNYFRYGGRGIKVCDRWKSFDAFLIDMGKRPPGLSIERVNNHGDYEPANCKWADRRAQSTNTRKVENSSTGVVGVHMAGNGKYHAIITVGKKRIHIGTFTGISEAAKARKEFESFVSRAAERHQHYG